MPKTTSVALGDHFTGFIAEQMASGRYASASEVVRAGLRLLEERERAREDLRAEIRKGEESGEPVPWDPATWRARWKAEFARDAD